MRLSLFAVLFLLSFAECVCGTSCFVAPAANGTGTACSLAQPCTLTQALATLVPGDRIELLTGYGAYLSSDCGLLLTVANTRLLSNDGSSRAVFQCGTSPQGINVQASQVTLERLEFLHDLPATNVHTAVSVVGVQSSLVVKECSFRGWGSGVESDGSGMTDLTVQDSVFTDNVIAVELQYCTTSSILRNNFTHSLLAAPLYQVHGGSPGGSHQISRCHFYGMTAAHPTAILIDGFDASSVSITDCVFRDLVNTGSVSGGALKVNSIPAGAPVSIKRCQFSNIHCTGSGNGGAVSLDSSTSATTNLLLELCSFRNTSSALCGGAVHLAEVPVTSVKSCTFEDCSAGSGGALCFASSSVPQWVVLDRVLVEHCAAATLGGALYASKAQLLNTDVIGCQAATGGAALWLEDDGQSAGDSLRLTNASFSNCSGASLVASSCFTSALSWVLDTVDVDCFQGDPVSFHCGDKSPISSARLSGASFDCAAPGAGCGGAPCTGPACSLNSTSAKCGSPRRFFYPQGSGTSSPTAAPSLSPTASLSLSPTATPSLNPTAAPSLSPSAAPSLSPTASVSLSPTATPSLSPTAPSLSPTASPSLSPTAAPSLSPSAAPSLSPTASVSLSPTATPSLSPTAPSLSPTASPSLSPTAAPSLSPSAAPSLSPTASVSLSPTATPSLSPTAAPSLSPTASPSLSPTAAPTAVPSTAPSGSPSSAASASPTSSPTASPSSAVPSVVQGALVVQGDLLVSSSLDVSLPGASLTLLGQLQLGSQALLTVSSSNAPLNVTGQVVLAGSLVVSIPQAPAVGSPVMVQVLQASSVTGDFSTLQASLSAGASLRSCESLLVTPQQQPASFSVSVSLQQSSCGASPGLIAGAVLGSLAVACGVAFLVVALARRQRALRISRLEGQMQSKRLEDASRLRAHTEQEAIRLSRVE